MSFSLRQVLPLQNCITEKCWDSGGRRRCTICQSSEPDSSESEWFCLATACCSSHISLFIDSLSFLSWVIPINIQTCCAISTILLKNLFSPQFQLQFLSPFSPSQISEAPWKGCLSSLYHALLTPLENKLCKVICHVHLSILVFLTFQQLIHVITSPWNTFSPWLSEPPWLRPPALVLPLWSPLLPPFHLPDLCTKKSPGSVLWPFLCLCSFP